MIEALEKLAAAGIELIPLEGMATHFVFGRDGYVALVERNAEGFGGIGSAGLLTERGLAVLTQRDGSHHFVARGLDQPATPEQVADLRSFANDLKAALDSSPR